MLRTPSLSPPLYVAPTYPALKGAYSLAGWCLSPPHSAAILPAPPSHRSFRDPLPPCAHSTLYPSARVTLSSHPTATPTAHIQPRLQLVSLKSADAVEKCAKLQTTHLNVGCPDSSISMALNSHKTSVKINSLCFSTTPLQIYCESPVLAEGDTDNQSRTLG